MHIIKPINEGYQTSIIEAEKRVVRIYQTEHTYFRFAGILTYQSKELMLSINIWGYFNRFSSYKSLTLATFPPLVPSLVEALFTLVLLQLINFFESYFWSEDPEMKSKSTHSKSRRSDERPFRSEERGSLIVSGETTEKLRNLLRQVKEDTIEKRELIQALNLLCRSIQKIYIVQRREIPDNDNEFSELLDSFELEEGAEAAANSTCEVEGRRDEGRPTMVPKEVRSWLETTFTKQAAWPHNTSNTSKLTFKQAAIKVKARIKLHRLFGTGAFSCLKPSPEANLMFRENVEHWNFNVFELNTLVEGHALTYMGVKLFQRHHICDEFNIPCKVLEAFLSQLECGYNKYGNPYHNLVHATDVVHTCNSIMEGSGLSDLMTPEERFAVLFAALIHDFEHSGTTNAFQINVRSHLALLYNDRGVLENHHISAAYRVTQLPAFNIFINVPRSKFQEIRQLVIEMVLNTDMSLHFSQIKTVGKLVKLPDPIEKPKAYSLMLHAADISHPTKSWDLHEKWTNMLVEEFFNQGDRETALGLPCSPLCDRHTTMVPQSQVGFISFIVTPTFQLLGEMLEKMYKDEKRQQMQDREECSNSELKQLQYPGNFMWIEQLQANKSAWEKRASQDGAEKAEAQ